MAQNASTIIIKKTKKTQNFSTESDIQYSYAQKHASILR